MLSLHIGGGKSISTVLIVIITIIGAALLGVFLCLAWRFKSKLKGEFHSSERKQFLAVI